MIHISEIEQVFRNIFTKEDGLVKSIEVLYEKPKGRSDFLKMIISIHGLSIEDISVIHTKFIFRVDNNRRNLYKNSFIYLYDLNCKYSKVYFNSIYDLEKKIKDIIESNDFGQDMKILSDFIEAPAMFLNYYMRRSGITEYSVFDVSYEPKFRTTPCDQTTFDFKININNNYNVFVSIKKIEDNSEVYYKLQFKLMDEILTIKVDTLYNLHFLIGENISNVLDKKLKNK